VSIQTFGEWGPVAARCIILALRNAVRAMAITPAGLITDITKSLNLPDYKLLKILRPGKRSEKSGNRC